MAEVNEQWEIPAQRLARISELIRSRGAMSVSEIAEILNISESTVRRDLQKLSDNGTIRREHGGAVSIGFTSYEPQFSERRHQNLEQKQAIGRYALRFIEPGQSIVFDSSSTVLALVEALKEHPIPITAVTNDINIASELTSVPGVEILVTGGEIRPGSFTLWGHQAQQFLKNIHADLAFMGIHAISGITLSDSSLRVAAMKHSILNAAHRVVLLADCSKFGSPAFIEVTTLHAVHDLVTNQITSKTAIDTIAQEAKDTRIHLA